MTATETNFWFTSTLDAKEKELTEQKVPPLYWGYILANGAPNTPSHDQLGAIYRSRNTFEQVAATCHHDMGVTVVDGRNIDLIRQWIGGRDWSDKEENKWSQEMDSAREQLQKEGNSEHQESDKDLTVEDFLTRTRLPILGTVPSADKARKIQLPITLFFDEAKKIVEIPLKDGRCLRLHMGGPSKPTPKQT